MNLEIVTHCYQYPRLLRYHLSSFILNPPESLDLKITICFTEEDPGTGNILEWFANIAHPKIQWNWIPLPSSHLCRRSIGRNLAALATKADWVWFCDVDYWFQSNCWDALSSLKGVNKPLIFPKYVNLHQSLAIGDERISKTSLEEKLISAPTDEFRPVRMHRAIGGIQIAKGDICRERGYLKNSERWQSPTSSAGFKRCREDKSFRRDLRTSGQAVNIPGVYRIRHSKKGRYNSTLCL